MILSRQLIRLITLTIVVSALLISGTISALTLSRFNSIEDQELSDNISRVNEAFNADLDSLSSKNGDWSNWDDAYNFVKGTHPDFVSTNMPNNAFYQLQVSGMYFFDVNKGLVISKFVDPISQADFPIPTGLSQYLARSQLLDFTTQPDKRGVVEFGQKDYLFSARPILTSEGTGPAVGSLVFLRLLDQAFVTQLSHTVHSDISLYRYNSPSLPAEIAGIKEVITPTFQPQRHLGTNITTGYSLISDSVTNKPILIWRVAMPRTSYSLGRQTVIIFIIYFSLIGAIAGLILVYLMRRIILNRLQSYQKDLEHIRSTGDLGQQITVTGNDEITVVGNAINQFLTRLKNSLDELSTEKDKASTILQAMGEGLVVVNSDLKIIAINPAAEKLLEVEKNDVLGEDWTQIVSPYNQSQKISHEDRSVVKVLKTNQPIYVRAEDNRFFETRSGKRFPVATVTTPFHGGKISGAVVIFRDITQEKNLQLKIESKVTERTQALDEAKARLIASINSLNVGFIMVDQLQSILLINQAALNIFHHGHEDGKSHTPESEIATITTFSQVMGQDLSQIIKRCLKEQKRQLLEKISLGSLVVNVAVSPILQRKDVIGAVILLEDITAQIALERSKDEFFSIASHELRTPLTTIRGNSELIMQYYAKLLKDVDLKQMVEDIRSSSVRLIGIVNDYLNVSRLEQKRISFVIEPFDIYKLAVKVTKELTNSAKEKKLTLKLQALSSKSADTNVLADSSRTEEVLTNLIGNAIKYTDQGTVTVEVQPSLSTVKVLITDTGRGIPPESQNSLFRKFNQAASNLYVRDPSKSTGLGLYISKLLVAGMGGMIQLERSTLGKGSIFSFVLPKPSKKEAKKILNESPKNDTVQK